MNHLFEDNNFNAERDRLEMADELLRDQIKNGQNSASDELNTNTSTVYTDDGETTIVNVLDDNKKKKVNISRATNVLVTYTDAKTGQKKTIKMNCKKVAEQAQYFADALTHGETDFLLPYLAKPIIWTFACGTAYTDGIRIACNPLFAKKLIAAGKSYLKAEEKDIFANASSADEANTLMNLAQGRIFQFVLVHECYHLIYLHIRRGAVVYGTGNNIVAGMKAAQLGNITMDLEINRDIEYQFPKFSGCTSAIDGMWWQDSWAQNKETGRSFANETWETMYEYFKEHPDQLPKRSNQDKSNLQNNLNNQNLNSLLNNQNSLSGNNQNKISNIFKKGWEAAHRAIMDGDIIAKNC